MLKDLSGGMGQGIFREVEKLGEAFRIFGITEKQGIFEAALSYHRGV